jgi:LuxR family transcriptional regulator, maltose regulon positive regulatory protein
MVIRSKLLPPQPHRGIFHREHLQELLQGTYGAPLTLIHAGTGFGKTTALLELSALYKKVFWYQLSEPDRDPMLFLAHLLSACVPGSTTLIERLENGGPTAAPAVMTALLNQLTLDLEEDCLLVLDDYHLVSDVTDINRWFEQLVENRPPRLHIAIACRKIPETPSFIRWRVKATLLVIDQSDLSFSVEEIKTLFTDLYGFSITPEQAHNIYSYTDGWIIALQMIWQRLQISHSKLLDRILSELPNQLSETFNFLAQEVLHRQPEEVQRFLLSSAVLRLLAANACNALLDITNSQEILRSLVEKGLFTFSVDDVTYRYQRLFQDFLLDQGKSTPEKMRALYKKAADYYVAINDHEEAIYHLFSCGENDEAARLIESTGPRLLEIGRLRTISKWIDKLDDGMLDMHPRIRILQGDVQRLRSQFEDAINSYNRADKLFTRQKDLHGRSQALRSMAQVYLDTIRPLKASSLLEEALALLEPQEHPAEAADLMDQLAENKLNMGKPEDARAMHKEASMLRSESDPDDIYLEARALLRTGHLETAIEKFETYHPEMLDVPGMLRPQRFHREMPLLLSLIHLMLGNIEKGAHFARQGVEIGRRLDSPFVEAVGLMRLGHAAQLYPQTPWRNKRFEEACNYYQRAIDLVKPFNVVRVQVEPLWGLCRYYGYQGHLSEARRLADQAIDIAETSGDSWFVALLLATMGTSYALAGEYGQAEEWLQKSADRFIDVGDIFGKAASQVAQVFNLWQNANRGQALDLFDRIIPLLKNNGFDLLLTRPSFLGLQEMQPLLPLIHEAYQKGIEREWLASLPHGLNLAELDYHPGYSLAIRTLGKFDVWRGKTLTSPRDWQREKARQLFQFFISNNGKWFSREQLADRLWPDLDADASAQNLKVALNALTRALEPLREPGQAPFFITRRDALYGVNPNASIAIDTEDFLALTGSSNIEDLRTAHEIYQGDYLCENCQESWATPTRDQLHQAYLLGSNGLASMLFDKDQWDESMHVCHDILSADPCNEPAFRILMRCHAARGNRSAVHSVYQRCSAALREDLDVEPSGETIALYKQLTR